MLQRESAKNEKRDWSVPVMFLQSRSFKLNPNACSDSELSCLLLGCLRKKLLSFFFCLAFSFWQVSKEPSLCVTS